MTTKPFVCSFRTTEAYISGGICGSLWMPGVHAGAPINHSLRALFDRFTEPVSFRDALLLLLSERGGDFQNPAFTADTRLVVIRRKPLAHGYELHIRERELSQLESLKDLINEDTYTADFFGEEE